MILLIWKPLETLCKRFQNTAAEIKVYPNLSNVEEKHRMMSNIARAPVFDFVTETREIFKYTFENKN